MPITDILDITELPLTDILDITEMPLTDILDITELPLTDILDITELPLTDIMDTTKLSLTDILHLKNCVTDILENTKPRSPAVQATYTTCTSLDCMNVCSSTQQILYGY